tara:strand:+ start:832 stop:2205 length:1374 start_codon:yes stop_codon:yes gene_type:complete
MKEEDKITNEYSIDYVLKRAAENDVRFVRLWFCDIFGTMKGFGITIDELESVLLDGASFDGSVMYGPQRSKENEMIAIPDPSTFQILPWRPQKLSVARLMCNIVDRNGNVSSLDSRQILKNTLKKLKEEKMDFYVGPEIEYFYLKDSKSMEPIDQETYFDQTTHFNPSLDKQDLGSELNRETVIGLEKMGIPVQKFQHEVSPGQHEIGLRYSDALTMADSIVTFKILAKEMAMKENVLASFMPKPFSDLEGNGMHAHLSLFKNGKNLFVDQKSDSGISKEAKFFTAGLLKHVDEFMMITNQWINSYKRIATQNEAPSYKCWSNESTLGTLIRIPSRRKGSIDSSRIEFRVADPACNPYLSFAMMISSGLEGIKNKYELEPQIKKSIKDFTAEEMADLNNKKLPFNLGEAIKIAEKSSLLKNTIGVDAFEVYLESKEREWQHYSESITDFEIKSSINL